MSADSSLGALVQSFFLDLVCVKGLRPASVRSYRDTLRLFLAFVAADKQSRITALRLEDLTFERVLTFLKYLEAERGNHIATRNQRLAALHCLYDYIASRDPQVLAVCQRVAAIPRKRVAPPQTHYLEKDEVEALLRGLPREGRHALRDRALVLFLYNTGARVSEVADLRVSDLDLGAHPTVRLHGKGDKWRTCPLWQQTAGLLRDLTTAAPNPPDGGVRAVFTSSGRPLTRSGVYKVVRRHAAGLDDARTGRQVSPHTFRHTAAIHLLESGVEVNVIRGWLGHVDLSTTNRYAEINTKTKLAALEATQPPDASGVPRTAPIWRSDETLLKWLASL